MANGNRPPTEKRHGRQKEAADATAALGSRIEAVQLGYAHPVSVLLVLVYLANHVGVLFQQSGLWFSGLFAGQGLTLAAHARLAFLLHELASVRSAWRILIMCLYGVKGQEGADGALVTMSFFIPMFQHLFAINGTRAQPKQKLWGFHLILMVLGVMAEFRPSHSLVQAICTGTGLT